MLCSLRWAGCHKVATKLPHPEVYGILPKAHRVFLEVHAIPPEVHNVIPEVYGILPKAHRVFLEVHMILPEVDRVPPKVYRILAPSHQYDTLRVSKDALRGAPDTL